MSSNSQWFGEFFLLNQYNWRWGIAKIWKVMETNTSYFKQNLYSTICWYLWTVALLNNVLPQTVCWQDVVVNIEDHGDGVQELKLQGCHQNLLRWWQGPGRSKRTPARLQHTHHQSSQKIYLCLWKTYFFSLFFWYFFIETHLL